MRMDKEKFEIDNYVIDLDALMMFIISKSKKDTNGDQTITQTYALTDENNMSLIEKVINERKESYNEKEIDIKYDIMKSFLSTIISPIYDESNGKLIPNGENTDMYFGQLLSFNTLLNAGIITEINKEDK